MTNFEWRVIEPLLPNMPRGGPRVDNRCVLNGIFWVLPSGARWRDLPERYRLRTTCYNRFMLWRKAGAWDRLRDTITVAHDSDIRIIDGTSVRVYQKAATAGADHCLGRSRGGLTTKIHAVAEAHGLPIRLSLTAGQAHAGQIADMLLDHPVPRTIVLADKAYDADRIRELMQDQGPRPISLQEQPVLETLLQQAPLPRRNLIERIFSKLKHFRRGATRRQLPRRDPTRLDAAVASSLRPNADRLCRDW